MEVKDLKPQLVWECFDAITKVPRPSCHEEQIRAFLLDFAQKHSIAVRTDEVGNVVMTKPATPGHENAPTVILQAHMDMVAEKNNDVEHDFLKDPIETYIDGDWVKARGTTLGADNGIGAAAILAVLEDDTLVHPPLEAVFTVEEEIGMGGAADFDAFDLEGRRFLNMDTEVEGDLLVSCCGGRRMRVYLPAKRETRPMDKTAFAVRIRGLKGGHSGADIHLQRASANRLLGRTLYALRELTA